MLWQLCVGAHLNWHQRNIIIYVEMLGKALGIMMASGKASEDVTHSISVEDFVVMLMPICHIMILL